YLDAHVHSTGEDLYDHPGFRHMHEYVAHSMLPTGKYVFDFGDVFEGPITRAGKGEEYPRTHPQGRFHTNYNLLYRLAQRFKNGEAQGVANWLSNFNQVNAEDFWSLIWFDPSVESISIEKQRAWHYFPDQDVFYWRSNWTPYATAFAFKCGPSEGHHTLAQLGQFPDWRLSSGHAHPDANSFVIFARGQYLTGDSGYAGIPLTAHHNTLLFDNKGQANEGAGHDAFADVPYADLDQIRLSVIESADDQILLRGDATAAYNPGLGVTKFIRQFEYRDGQGFLVQDDVETSKPVVVSSLIHADSKLEQDGVNKYSIQSGDVKFSVKLIEPQDSKT